MPIWTPLSLHRHLAVSYNQIINLTIGCQGFFVIEPLHGYRHSYQLGRSEGSGGGEGSVEDEVGERGWGYGRLRGDLEDMGMVCVSGDCGEVGSGRLLPFHNPTSSLPHPRSLRIASNRPGPSSGCGGSISGHSLWYLRIDYKLGRYCSISYSVTWAR